LHDNTTKVFASIDVDPPHRCRGAGSALLDQVVQVAGDWSRDEVVGDLLAPAASTPEHPYRRFATKRGFTEASMESIRHLSLPVPDGQLDELAESARPYWGQRYDLATFMDGVPDALQQSLCDASNLLDVDAPSGDIEFEPESLTPERYRDELGLEREQGTTRLTTVALDRSDGRVVAFTDLIVLGGTRRAVWQWGTLVQAEHRGHRLGLAVKVANLRALQEAFPEREYVITGNADLNAWMVSINERLGFRVRELGPMYLRRL
jgi:hypothetical protein